MGESGYLVAASGLQTSKAVEVSETISYQLWKNVISRVEFRWDNDANDTAAFSNGKDNVFLVAANLLYKF